MLPASYSKWPSTFLSCAVSIITLQKDGDGLLVAARRWYNQVKILKALTSEYWQNPQKWWTITLFKQTLSILDYTSIVSVKSLFFFIYLCISIMCERHHRQRSRPKTQQERVFLPVASAQICLTNNGEFVSILQHSGSEDYFMMCIKVIIPSHHAYHK